MGKSQQGSEFGLQGRFLGFAMKDGYKLKYVRVETPEGEFYIKLAKELRASLAYTLIPGEWIQISGQKKFDDKTGKLKLKADTLLRITPTHLEPTITSEPIVASVSAKPQAKILVCQKSDCWKRGGKAICAALEQEISDRDLSDQVTIKTTGCMKQCKSAPNIIVNKTRYSRIHPEQVSEIIDQHFGSQPSESIEEKLPFCPAIL